MFNAPAHGRQSKKPWPRLAPNTMLKLRMYATKRKRSAYAPPPASQQSSARSVRGLLLWRLPGAGVAGSQEVVQTLLDTNVDEMRVRILMECASVLRTVVREEGLLKSVDLQSVMERVQTLEKRMAAGEMRNVDRLTKSDLDVWEVRLAEVEANKSKVGEGLRKKVQLLKDRHARVESLEEALQDEESEEATAKAVQDECRFDEQPCLQAWREDLRPGMPVHLGDLTNRSDLLGKAGWLGHFHAEKQRWVVQVGQEVLLVRAQNIFP